MGGLGGALVEGTECTLLVPCGAGKRQVALGNGNLAVACAVCPAGKLTGAAQ